MFTDGLEGAGAGRGVCTLESHPVQVQLQHRDKHARRDVQGAGGTAGGCPASAEESGEVP